MMMMAAIPALAQSEQVQTDWSGGPGASGPLIQWESQFQNSLDISWRSIEGQLVLSAVEREDPIQDIIAGNAGMPSSVGAGDVNGDGRADILSTDAVYDVLRRKGAVYWWENLASGNWAGRLVSGDFWGAYYVDSADVDGDGDLDVIAAAYYGIADPAPPPPPERNGRFAWFENLQGDGSAWSQHVVGEMFWGANYIDAADIDGDGDVDLIGSAEIARGIYEKDGDVIWFENLDGEGDIWAEHAVIEEFDHALRAKAADIDSDGDIDIVAARSGDLSWWENVSGDGLLWAKQPIFVDEDGAGYFDTGDIDNDGDMDILGTSYNAQFLFWWENIDGAGDLWQTRIIAGLTNVWDLDVADLDGDGDLDALLCRNDILPLALTSLWAENPLGEGPVWSFHFLKNDLPGRTWVAPADADADGKLDAVLAFEDVYREEIEQLSWFNLTQFKSSGGLLSSVLDGGAEPAWSAFSWDATVAADTSLEVQVRASSDSANLGPFVSVPYSGCALANLIDPNARYLQYRLLLSSSNSSVSPVVREVKIGPGAPQLALSPPVPGLAGTTNTITATWPEAGDLIYFAYSLIPGSTILPGPCPGVELGLGDPQLLGSAAVSGEGDATLSASVPMAADGRTVYLQAIEASSCTVSNVVMHTFD